MAAQVAKGGSAGGVGVAVAVAQPPPTNTLYIGNLDASVTDAQLYELFSLAEVVESSRVCRDNKTRISLGYAFLEFYSSVEAAKALKVMNGNRVFVRPMYVAFAQSKKDRKAMLQQQPFPGMRPGGAHMPNCMVPVVQQGQQGPCQGSSGAGSAQGHQTTQPLQQQQSLLPQARHYLRRSALRSALCSGGVSFPDAQPLPTTKLYVGDLDASVMDSQLYELFSLAAPVRRVRICRDDNTQSSLGYAFVEFATPVEAARAHNVMNGNRVFGRKMYVAFLQHKKDRKAMLQAQVSQMPAVPITPLPVGQPMPPLGQLFYGQAPPAMMPPQLFPGMRPDGAHMPNYLVQVVQQGQQGPHPGSSGAGCSAAGAVPVAGGGGVAVDHPPPKTKLYVRDLDPSVVEEDLLMLFKEVAFVRWVIIGRDRSTLLGHGYLECGTPVDAARAIQVLRGKLIHGKPLHIKYANAEQEKMMQVINSRLSSYNTPLIPISPGPHWQQYFCGMNSQFPTYHPTGPIGKFNGQVPPAMMPHHQMPEVLYDGNFHVPAVPVWITKLTAALANATPEQEIELIWGHLFPLVEQREPSHTFEIIHYITSHMDTSEILRVMMSAYALNWTVSEAMNVIRNMPYNHNDLPNFNSVAYPWPVPVKSPVYPWRT